MLGFALSNPTAEDRDARVLTFHGEASGRQYGRDVWVPARATLHSWSCLGPVSSPPGRGVVELKSLLYDRTGGREQLLRSPQGPPLYSELVRFHRKEPGTVLMIDADVADGSQDAPLQQDAARASDVRDLVRVFRHHAQLSERVNSITQRFLPPVPESLDGVDHFVLASDRISEDAPGRRVLRDWLASGGTLWVMLDAVRQETVSSLLGDVPDLQIVDRVSLTNIQIRNGPVNAHRAEVAPVEVEDPVDFVRVLAPGLQVLYTIDGWPAAILKDVGRGRVLFTTLGARGWMRDRTARDPRSRYSEFQRLPVALVPFEFLAGELHPGPDRPPLTADELRSSVAGQISYSVVGRNRVLLVFGLLLLSLCVAAAALSRTSRLEHLGWLGPALAVGAAGVFIVMGQQSRGEVPATLAMTQLVDAEAGLDEVHATGFLAVYHPSLNTTGVGVEEGGSFDLDTTGLEGRVHRRMQTDMDRWHWENLDLPAGVRTGPFRRASRTSNRVEAVVRFGPNGVEGRVHSGPFGVLEDVLVSTPGRHTLAVTLGPDGSFRAGSEEELHGGELVVGALLTDRQRARRGLYERLLAEPQPRSIANRNLLLAWAEPIDLHFKLGAESQKGSALLMIPLQFERTPPGTSVTIPAAFVECRRVTSDGRQFRPAVESPLATTMKLRFQLPASAWPLTVERARLILQLHAPGREVVVGVGSVPIERLTSPLGAVQVEIDPRSMRPNEDGVMVVNVEIGAAGGSGDRNVWRLESAGLEVRGRTPAEGEHEPR